MNLLGWGILIKRFKNIHLCFKDEDFGGILIEEFIRNKTRIVYKIHILVKLSLMNQLDIIFIYVVLEEHLNHIIHLTDLLDKIDSELFDTNQYILDKLNPF